MKISELIEKDRKEKIKNQCSILNQAEIIKSENQQKKLTYYNFYKENILQQLKVQDLPLQQKATLKTKLFNVDNAINELKKDILKNK